MILIIIIMMVIMIFMMMRIGRCGNDEEEDSIIIVIIIVMIIMIWLIMMATGDDKRYCNDDNSTKRHNSRLFIILLQCWELSTTQRLMWKQWYICMSESCAKCQHGLLMRRDSSAVIPELESHFFLVYLFIDWLRHPMQEERNTAYV